MNVIEQRYQQLKRQDRIDGIVEGIMMVIILSAMILRYIAPLVL